MSKKPETRIAVPVIRLERFDQNDYGRLISWIDSEEALLQFAGPAFRFPLTTEQLQESEKDKSRFSFRIIETGTGSSIGHAEIYLTEDNAYLGRVLIGEENLRARGLGQAIVNQVLAYAFYDLGQYKVTLHVFEWNSRAIKCYEKVGFILTGKKMERQIKGATWIALAMSLDKKRWEELRSERTNS
jgi:RimJ/RimL family protein N-acetyltransferase